MVANGGAAGAGAGAAKGAAAAAGTAAGTGARSSWLCATCQAARAARAVTKGGWEACPTRAPGTCALPAATRRPPDCLPAPIPSPSPAGGVQGWWKGLWSAHGPAVEQKFQGAVRAVSKAKLAMPGARRLRVVPLRQGQRGSSWFVPMWRHTVTLHARAPWRVQWMSRSTFCGPLSRRYSSRSSRRGRSCRRRCSRCGGVGLVSSWWHWLPLRDGADMAKQHRTWTTSHVPPAASHVATGLSYACMDVISLAGPCPDCCQAAPYAGVALGSGLIVYAIQQRRLNNQMNRNRELQVRWGTGPGAAGGTRGGAGMAKAAMPRCSAQRSRTTHSPVASPMPPGGADWAAEGAAGSAAARQHAQGGQGVPLGQQRATWLGNVQPAACKPPHAPASMQASDRGIHAASTTCPPVAGQPRASHGRGGPAGKCCCGSHQCSSGGSRCGGACSHGVHHSAALT